MILFQLENNEQILSGIKQYTIRKGDRRKRLKVGGIHKCKNQIFTKDFFAKIKIISIDVKKFDELTEKDAKHDLFKNLEELRKRLVELNGEDIKKGLVSVIKFKQVRVVILNVPYEVVKKGLLKEIHKREENETKNTNTSRISWKV